MKKKFIMLALALTAINLSACSGKNADNAVEEAAVTAETSISTETSFETEEIAETSAETEEWASSEGAEEPMEYVAAYDDYIVPYEYTGTDPLYRAVYEYLAENLSKDYEKSNVSIPVVMIVDMDESDDNDIKVWGDFRIYNYNYEDDTLFCVSGGDYPGCLHLKKSGDDYSVSSFETAEDGSGWEKSMKEIFGDHYKEMILLNAANSLSTMLREHVIADYVQHNNLAVFSYKDYGQDSVALPTDVGNIHETDEINLTKESDSRYTFTYDGEKFTAEYSEENWKIKDSYKIKLTRDMEVICEALIAEHPIHSADYKSYRTASDMAFEWLQHNQAYDLLPEGNSFTANVKDVDLNPDDQGKNYMELFENRTGKRAVISSFIQ